MVSVTTALFVAVAAVVGAQSSYGNGSSPFPPFSGDPFQKYSLSASGINATFIPYGARITNLYVKDKNGKYQDVVVGYDDGKEYLHDSETNHTYFGAVVGRYANRYVAVTACRRDGTADHMHQDQERHLHGGRPNQPHPGERT